jgi:uncharacterized protein (TIGR03067 family)
MFKGMTVTFEGDKYTVKKGDKVIQVGRQKLDPSRSPKAVDVTVAEGLNKGAAMLGIYEISGDTLKVCFDPEGKKRPTEFKSAPGSQTFVNVHKRVKKGINPENKRGRAPNRVQNGPNKPLLRAAAPTAVARHKVPRGPRPLNGVVGASSPNFGELTGACPSARRSPLRHPYPWGQPSSAYLARLLFHTLTVR